MGGGQKTHVRMREGGGRGKRGREGGGGERGRGERGRGRGGEAELLPPDYDKARSNYKSR